MSKTKIIHLIGFPGTGKYTIAKELCKDESLTLIDNHTINNVLFNTLDLQKTLPEKVFGHLDSIYDILFETMSTISPLDKSFVFTNTLINEYDSDRFFVNKIIDVSKKRQAEYIPIRLVCNKNELYKRVVTPERKKKLKLTDTNMLDSFISGKSIILTENKNELTLDVSSLSLEEAVEKIKNYVDIVLNK